VAVAALLMLVGTSFLVVVLRASPDERRSDGLAATLGSALGAEPSFGASAGIDV
jgi:hypothetical protein